MLFKLTVPAVFVALLLNTLAATGVGAVPQGPIILPCSGADDTTSGPSGDLCCFNTGAWRCQAAGLECTV
ncbi:hypothetical protein BDP27DRAFT_1310366 [Rhodocollybia butyracea]|uniref:Uncharacterized protein n=1 Tax=Rhodocollybia butyracea TaxID=206335 RepID=A0A9P5Q9M4_9AGAR|nr:hypothetical protein BDP27DRAFT_1310366 [Rhodocollybia butyracea]